MSKVNNKDLSGVMVVLMIGGSVLCATVLFIFAKRQIYRYTIRSRHTPHAPTGQDAKKGIKREIERRLECVSRIYFEPQLWKDDPTFILKPGTKLPPFYYRQKAVDDVKLLEKEIPVNRIPRDSLRSFLLSYLSTTGSSQRLIHQFIDKYEAARFDPSDFGDDEYQKYHNLLLKMLDAAKITKNLNKTSPNRTPIKKQSSKMQSLLDPSRLRPPQSFEETRNSRLNLSLGVHLQQQQMDENEILSISHIHTESGISQI